VYPSPRIIKMIKTIRMRWTGHVAHRKEKSNTYRYREKNVRWILQRWERVLWNRLIWLRAGISGGLL
jgi:hypothetical protein